LPEISNRHHFLVMKVETKRKCVCVYALRIQTSTIKNSACFGNRGKHYLNAEFGEKQQRGRGKREGKKRGEDESPKDPVEEMAPAHYVLGNGRQ